MALKEGIEVEIYGYANPFVLKATIVGRFEPQTLEEMGGTGGGSVKVLRTDPRLIADPTLLDMRNVVKIKVNAQYVGAFIINKKTAVIVGEGEAAAEYWELAGEGTKIWFADADVKPFGGLKKYSLESRSFNFASEQAHWYNAANWVAPKNIGLIHKVAWWGERPKNWHPNIPSATWIWGANLDGSNNAVKGSVSYFRNEFTVATDTKFRIYAAGDDSLDLYIDGQQLSTSDPKQGAFGDTTKVDFTVPAGNHVLAARVENIFGGPAGFVAALVWLNELDNEVLYNFTGQSSWKVFYNPSTPPAWTPGSILLTLLDEAEARGVKFPTWLEATFSEDYDSNGDEWDASLDWSFDIGTPLSDVISQFEEAGISVWIDPNDYWLNATPNRGLDRTDFYRSPAIINKNINPNPRYRKPGTVPVEIRRNYFLRPRMDTLTGFTAPNGASISTTGANGIRVICQAGVSAGQGLGLGGGLLTAVASGDVVTYSADVTGEVAATGWYISVQGSTVAATSNSAAVTIGVGETKRISFTVTHTGAGTPALYVLRNNSAIASQCVVSKPMQDFWPAARDFFSGDTVAHDEFIYGWSGTANQSASIEKATNLDNTNVSQSIGYQTNGTAFGQTTAVRFLRTGIAAARYGTAVPLESSKAYTLLIQFRVSNNTNNMTLVARPNVASGTSQVSLTMPVTNLVADTIYTWAIPFTMGSAAVSTPGIAFIDAALSIGQGRWVEISQLGVIEGTYNDEFFDGSTADTLDKDYAWVGAINSSTSTRTLLLPQSGLEPIIFEKGRNLLDAKSESVGKLTNSLTVKTNSGWQVVNQSLSQLKYGVLESQLDSSADENLSITLVNSVFSSRAQEEEGATYTIVPDDKTIPYLHFTVGDYVLAPNDKNVLVPRRVMSISVTEQENGQPQYDIEFDVIFQDQVTRLQKTVSKARGSGGSGAKFLGTGTGSIWGAPVVSPSGGIPILLPAKVTGLTGSSAGAWTPDGITAYSAMTLNWAPTTQNTDGTATTPTAYEVWSRITSLPNDPYERIATVTTNQAIVQPFVPSQSYTFKVRALNLDDAGEFSDPFSHTMVGPTTAPPKPTTPILSSDKGLLIIGWDGLLDGNNPPPLQFRYAYAEVALAGSGTWNRMGPSFLRDTRSITVPGLTVGAQYFVRLIAVDGVGIKSANSTAADKVIVGINLGSLEADVAAAISDAKAAGTAAQATANGANVAAGLAQNAANAAQSSANSATVLATIAQQTADTILAQSPEQITNGGFEQDFTNWTLEGTPAITTVAGRFHTGAKAAQFMASAGETRAVLTPSIPVVPGRRFRATFWTFSTGSSNNAIVNVVDQAGTQFAWTPWVTSPTNAFVKNTFDFTIPAGVTSFKLRFGKVNSTVTQYLDDVSLLDITDAYAAQVAADAAALAAATAQTKADTAFNNAATAQTRADNAFTNAGTAQTAADAAQRAADALLAQSPEQVINGGFETSTFWVFTGNGAYQTTPVHGGLRSAGSTTGSGDVSTGLYTTVAGTRYRLTYWFYLVSGPATGGIRIATSANATIGGLQTTFPTTPTGSWQKITYDFTIPSGTTQFKVRFATSAGSWRIDDVSLLDITDAYNAQQAATAAQTKADQAYADAATAQAKAVEAFNNAATAQGTATTALSTANGKNKVIFSTTDATGTTGYSAGDIWFKRTGTVITAQWEFTTSWESRKVDGAALANLDAGTITVGLLNADRIGVNTLTGDKFKANTVTSREIVITDFTNFASGSDFEDATANPWLSLGADVIDTTVGHTGSASLKIPSSGAGTPVLATKIACQPGDRFYISYWMMRDAAWNGTNANSKIRVGQGIGGALIAGYGYGADQMPEAMVWTQKTYVLAIPDNATYTSLQVTLPKDATAGNLWLDDIEIRQMNNGKLTVDGSIGALAIAAEAITTMHLRAGAVDTPQLQAESVISEKVAADAIKAIHIEAEAVEADKIKGGAVETRHLSPDVGGQLDISANESVNILVGRADEIEAGANATADDLSEMQTYYQFGTDGAVISKPGSPYSLALRSDTIEMIANGQVVSYWNAGTMYVTSMVGEQVILGNHKIEKFGTGTVVRAL